MLAAGISCGIRKRAIFVSFSFKGSRSSRSNKSFEIQKYHYTNCCLSNYTLFM